MKQKKSYIAIGLVLILSIIGVLVHRMAFAKETTAYRFATIERGNLQSTVSATGTLNAVTTVSVGTQVSGQVSQLLVDFNDHVKKGQLLARIDPTLALAAVTDAQANLEKAQAQSLQASRDYARNRELTNDGLVARSAFEVAQSDATVANAGVKSARVALDRARQNLSYTSIYAPIDGVVVERNVQQGRPSRPPSPRRSSSSSPTTSRRWRSWPRSARATSPRSSRAKPPSSPCRPSRTAPSRERSSRSACSRPRRTTSSTTPWSSAWPIRARSSFPA